MNIKEIDYHLNVDGLGYEAFIYELSEGKRYSVVMKYEGKHCETLRTDSRDRAIEAAERWTY